MSELFPGSPVPSASRQKFILPWSGSLAELLASSWLSGLSVGPTSLRFLVPPTASPGLAPHRRLVTSVRFRSQDSPTLRPTSSQRFPSRPKVCGRISDRTVLGIPPFRVFPSQQIACASRRSLASLRLSSGVLRRTVRVLVTDGFPDVHAFTQLPGSPADYELPFHAPKHASWSLWVSRRGAASFHQHHPLRSFHPSCESVRDWVGSPLPNRPIPSWVSAPLELSPSTPRILDPPRLEARTLAFARRLQRATQRTATPCAG